MTDSMLCSRMAVGDPILALPSLIELRQFLDTVLLPLRSNGGDRHSPSERKHFRE